MKRNRTSSGSMIALVSLSIAVIILVAFIGIIFNSLLFQNSRGQHKVDAVALSLARSINAGNRVGQINELEDRCRELVYVSRQSVTGCGLDDFAYLSPLCNQLLSEARDGQALVEAERANQIHAICRDVQDAAVMYNNKHSAMNPSLVAALQTQEPRITQVALGSIKDLESNVRTQAVFRDLTDYDQRAELFDEDSGLYYGPIDARLPGADGDLVFKFSALPAAVNGIIAQPRNTNADVFIPYGKVMENGQPSAGSLQDIPNAVQVSCVMDASVGSNGANRVSMNIVSTGITTGASPEPQD